MGDLTSYTSNGPRKPVVTVSVWWFSVGNLQRVSSKGYHPTLKVPYRKIRLLSANVHTSCWWSCPPSPVVTLHRWLSSQCMDRVYIPAAQPATGRKVPLTRLRHFLPAGDWLVGAPASHSSP